METNDLGWLATQWEKWGGMAHLTALSSSVNAVEQRAVFKSDDVSYLVSRDDSWWVVGFVNERGRTTQDVARFSSISLLQKYLVWDWAGPARSAAGLPLLGRLFHKQGLRPGAQPEPTSREYFKLVQVGGGQAVLPLSNIDMYSNVLEFRLADVLDMLNAGV